MYNSVFNDYMERFFEEVRAINDRKSDEYNADNDKYSNIKTSVSLQKIGADKVIKGYMAKHIVSLYDDTSSINTHEKILDIVTYLIMLDALEECKNEVN